MQPNHIGQMLLEEDTLDLQTAFKLSKQLDAAQKQALTYLSCMMPKPCPTPEGPAGMARLHNTERVANPLLAIGDIVIYVVLVVTLDGNILLRTLCVTAAVKEDITKKYVESLAGFNSTLSSVLDAAARRRFSKQLLR